MDGSDVPVDWVDTVLVDGRVYVCVEDLVRSLRGRAVMFGEIAAEPGHAGDGVFQVAALARAEELTSRADALVVAGIEHQHEHPEVVATPIEGTVPAADLVEPNAEVGSVRSRSRRWLRRRR